MQVTLDFDGKVFDEELGEVDYVTSITLDIEKKDHAIFYEVVQCRAEFLDDHGALVDLFIGSRLSDRLENSDVPSKLLKYIGEV